jgi:hypothetical protein
MKKRPGVDDLIANIAEELIVIEHADLGESQIDALVVISKRVDAAVKKASTKLWGSVGMSAPSPPTVKVGKFIRIRESVVRIDG